MPAWLIRGCTLFFAGSLLAVAGCDTRAGFDEPEKAVHAESALGDWQLIEQALQEPVETNSSQVTAPPVSELVERLEAKIAADPENIDLHTLLIQTYAFLGNNAGAEQAISTAVSLGADEATLRNQFHAAIPNQSRSGTW